MGWGGGVEKINRNIYHRATIPPSPKHSPFIFNTLISRSQRLGLAGLSLTCADRGSTGEAAGRKQELGAERAGPARPGCSPRQRLQVPTNKQTSTSSSGRVTEGVRKLVLGPLFVELLVEMRQTRRRRK